MDNISSGVSTSEVQYAICVDGKYGFKDYSSEEREAACERFEQITGISISPPDTTPNMALLAGVAVAGMVIGIVFGYLLCRYQVHKKQTREKTRRK